MHNSMNRVREIHGTVGVITTLITNFLVLIIKLGLGVLTARLLGARGKGLFVEAFYLPGLLVVLLGMSLGKALIYKVRRNELKPEHLFQLVVVYVVAISSVTLVAYYLFLPIIQKSLLRELNPALARVTILVFPAMLITHYVAGDIFRSLGRIQWANLFSILEQILPIGLILAFIALMNHEYTTVAYAYFAALNVLGVAALIMLLKISRPLSFALPPRELLAVGRFGLKYHALQVLSQIEYRSDILIMSMLLSAEQVGLYSVGVTMAQVIWMFQNSVAIVLFPRLSGTNDDESIKITNYVTRNTLFVNIVIGALIALLGRPLIHLLYGDSFQASYFAFLVLVPGIVANTIFRTTSTHFAGRGEPLRTARVSLFTMIGNIVLNIFLIPSLGIIGASLSSTVSYSCGAALMLYQYIRKTRAQWQDILLPKPSDVRRVLLEGRAYVDRHVSTSVSPFEKLAK